MQNNLLVFLTGVVACLAGCNRQSPDSAPVATAVAVSETSVPPDPALETTNGLPVETSPDQVVATFLGALKEGDDVTAESLLTRKAREETAKHDLSVRPPGSPTAQFQLAGVEYRDANRAVAHVNSRWTEYDIDGSPLDYEIVWALRRQKNGWRVAGMATQVFDDQPAVFFNFEDPDDMLKKWEAADAMAAQSPASGSDRQAERSGRNSASPQRR